MDLYIHYQDLPQGLTLEDFVGELNEVLDDHGSVCGGEDGRLDLDLEDETINQVRPDRGEGLSPAGRLSQGDRH